MTTTIATIHDEAREWLLDIVDTFTDPDYAEEQIPLLKDDGIEVAIEAHYDGGWQGFVRGTQS